jgi:hypothetical protein
MGTHTPTPTRTGMGMRTGRVGHEMWQDYLRGGRASDVVRIYGTCALHFVAPARSFFTDAPTNRHATGTDLPCYDKRKNG